jgi:hypothetical protein
MAIALSCHAACSSTASDGANGASGADGANGAADVSSCSVAGRKGTSSCQGDVPPGAPAKVPITCSAGTFCVAAGFDATCQPGCQSDENCGATERCVRCANAATGSCRTCNLSDADACAGKPKADAGPATCERNTFYDSDCSAPGKAFECPTTIEPTGQGTCAQTSLAGVWCCGGAVQTCKRDTFLDQSECSHPGQGGPRPPKGYRCDDGKEPADPKCALGDLPDHWCCPS